MLVLAFAAGRVMAQTPLVTLFEGEPTDQRTISVGSWGGGTASEATDFYLVGRESIKVRTSNLYRGARVDLVTPVDVSKAIANPNAYLQFAVYSTNRVSNNNTNLVDPSKGATPGTYNPGSYVPGGGSGTTTDIGYSPITEIRVILFFEEGALVLDRQRVEPYRQDQAGWSKFSIPVSKFGGGLSGYHLKRVVFCGNADDSVYLGEIQFVEDSTAIIVGVGEDYEVWKGTPIGMLAIADGGAATLQYEWDFDAKDGVTVDATGPIGQHTYMDPGDYTVTITVKDVDGIKAPKKIENMVHVISGG